MELIIVGAGGQGSVVAEIIQAAKLSGADLRAIGFVDDHVELHGTVRSGLPVLGSLEVLGETPHDGIVVAIGDNAIRREVTERLVGIGEVAVTVRHPFTSIAPGAVIGGGSMIAAGAIVVAGARIGCGVLLNTRSSVDHDAVVGDFAHLSPGVTVGGGVQLGNEVFVGLGASVVSHVRVGSHSIIGAGAVVVNDIGDGVVAIGVPARVTRRVDGSRA